MITEAIGLKYSVDSQGSEINIGKVLEIIPSNDNTIGLSVDNIRFEKSSSGLYFIDNPSLGISPLNYGNDWGGLAIGNDCRIHNCAGFAQGNSAKAVGRYAHAEGFQTIADWGCHAEGKFNEALGITNHVEGFSNQINNRSAVPNYVHVEGMYNTASGDIYAAHVGGTCANGVNSYSYTWNGNIGDVMDSDGVVSSGADVNRKLKLYTPLSPYSSHGEGTFNINPVGQETGVWIGEKTLADIIEQHVQPIFDVFDPVFNGDIFLRI